MYESIRIQNFRLFEDLTVDPLGRINLIGGKNNAGKTSLLEAIFLSYGPNRPEFIALLSQGRGMISSYRSSRLPSFSDIFWEDVFLNFDIRQRIELTIQQPNEVSRLIIQRFSGARQMKLDFIDITEDEDFEYIYTREQEGQQKGQYETIFKVGSGVRPEIKRANIANLPTAVILFARSRTAVNELADRFSKVTKNKTLNEIISVLHIIEPKLDDIRLLVEDGSPTLYCDTGGSRLTPITLMGDGFVRLLNILVNIVFTAPNGAVLLDEIENGLHYSILIDVWRALDEFSRGHNVQIFATTHSDECIRAAQHVFKDSEENAFRYHRLDRLEDGTIEAVTYNPQALEGTIERRIEMR